MFAGTTSTTGEHPAGGGRDLGQVSQSSNWILRLVSRQTEGDSDPVSPLGSDSPLGYDPPPEAPTCRSSSGGLAGDQRSPVQSARRKGKRTNLEDSTSLLLSSSLPPSPFLPLGNHNQEKHADLCKC